MVGNLRNMAIDMSTEVSNQNRQLGRIQEKAASNEVRVESANKRTQLLLWFQQKRMQIPTSLATRSHCSNSTVLKSLLPFYAPCWHNYSSVSLFPLLLDSLIENRLNGYSVLQLILPRSLGSLFCGLVSFIRLLCKMLYHIDLTDMTAFTLPQQLLLVILLDYVHYLFNKILVR